MDVLLHVERLRNLTVSQTDAVDISLFPKGAPYKALVLLCVFDLIRKDEIQTNRIPFTGTIEQRFETYKMLLQSKLPGKLPMPYSAMHHEPFWNLIMANGVSYDKVHRELRIMKNLVQYVEFAQFELPFWDTLQFDEIRGVYRQTLLDTYFSEHLHPRLWEFGLR